MAKALVETKDNIQVVGTGEELHARHNRASVVRVNKFISTHVTEGNLTLLAQLNDEASDKEFEKLWNEAAEGADLTKKADVEAVAAAREDLKTAYAKDYAPGGKEKPDPAPKPDAK
jgi:hypothetical protein